MNLQRLTRPDFIIIGAMKCATSTLHEQLARHRGIFMSSPKEPCFFSNDEEWRKGLDWYRGLFEAAHPTDLCGESSTHYTKLPTYPDTVTRMRDVLPDHVRFIYVMRHPIDRLISQYVHEWSQRVLDCPIDDAVEQCPELVTYSRYAMQVRPFLDQFGPERILPVFFERLTRNSQKEFERVAQFIGSGERPKWNDNSDRENASSERIRRSPIRSLVAAVPGLRPLLHAALPDATRDRLKARWRMTERPELSKHVRTRLEAVFDEDLHRLNEWLSLYTSDASLLPLTCATFKNVAQSNMSDNTHDREAVA